jgi:hypothetical protein
MTDTPSMAGRYVLVTGDTNGRLRTSRWTGTADAARG